MQTNEKQSQSQRLVALLKIKENTETNQEECNKVVEAADLKYDELIGDFDVVRRRTVQNAGQGAIERFEKEIKVLTKLFHAGNALHEAMINEEKLETELEKVNKDIQELNDQRDRELEPDK